MRAGAAICQSGQNRDCPITNCRVALSRIARGKSVHGGKDSMLTIWGAKQRFCDGISRRGFLKIGAFGAGLTLADMLRAKAQATAPAAGGRSSANKAAIMIYLPGGPSHMDMYDLKPAAPVEYRGEFRPIATNV